jgi:hypothetical protein
MAEAIHPRPNIMAEVRTTRGEGEERIVDILVFPESLGDQVSGNRKKSAAGRCEPYQVSDLGSDGASGPAVCGNAG